MKRITYYKAIRKEDRAIGFIEASGQLLEITDTTGMKVQFGVTYDRSRREYIATELTTGLGSHPLCDKTVDGLKKKLSEMNFKRVLETSNCQTFIKLMEVFKNVQTKN